MLVDKLRRAKEQIKVYEKENGYFREELKKYRENNLYLIARLHDSDLNLIGKMKAVKEASNEITRLQLDIQGLERKILMLTEEEKENNQVLIREVHEAREDCVRVKTQKKELILAFEELRDVFCSFSLKV